MFRDIRTAILSAAAIVLTFLFAASIAHAATGGPVVGQLATTSAKVDAADAPTVDLPAASDPAGDPRNAAIVLVRGGPVRPGVLTPAQTAALTPVRDAGDCSGVVIRLMVSGDYTPEMAPCLGDEDSPAVDTVLTLGGWVR